MLRFLGIRSFQLAFLAVFFTAAIFAQTAVAQNSQSDCEALFNDPNWLPPILTRSENVVLENKVLDVARLMEAVIIIDVRDGEISDVLANLPNGQYAFSIDTRLRLIILPRNLSPGIEAMRSDDAEFTGSHEGIRIVLTELDGVPPQFLAAGDLIKRSGFFLDVTNKAGSYFGDSANLAFTRERLILAGAKFSPYTRFRDYSLPDHGYKEPHLTNDGKNRSAQIRLEIEFTNDYRNAALVKFTHDVFQLAHQKLGDVREALFALAQKQVKNSDDERLLLFASFFASYWFSYQDGDAYLVWRFVHAHGAAEYRAMLNKVADIALAAKPAIPQR